jgi:RNA polymerase sigma-70 factor (ECF subfamily)
MRTEIDISAGLIKRFQDGDMSALQEIYELSKNYIFNIVYKMVQDRQETEDIVHDVFIKIYDKRKKYRSEMPFMGWLNRVAVNHTLNLIKRKKSYFRKLEQIFKDDNHEDDFTEDLVRQEDSKLALILLKKIPADYRICLILREMDDMNYEDIASVLKIKVGTVRSRLNRGRKLLSNLYREVMESDS